MKKILKYQAVPNNITGIGYIPRIVDADNTIADTELFSDICTAERLPYTPAGLQFAVERVIDYICRAVAADGIRRRIGNSLIVYPSLGGRMQSPYEQIRYPETKVACRLLPGVPRELDMDKLQLCNALTGFKVAVQRVSWIGADDGNTLIIGEPFAAYGRNMQFAAALGDEASLDWQDEFGVAHSLPLTCTESDYAHAVFAWPEEGIQPDPSYKVKFRLVSRAGIEDNVAQTTYYNVIVKAGNEQWIPQ